MEGFALPVLPNGYNQGPVFSLTTGPFMQARTYALARECMYLPRLSSCLPFRRRIDQRARDILQQLLTAGVGRRPIIWVSHSAGGTCPPSLITFSFNPFANASIRGHWQLAGIFQFNSDVQPLNLLNKV